MAERTKHLRCALVWEGILLDERIIPPGTNVTVGESPRATFTLHSPGLGKRRTILKAGRSQATLALVPGMLGRVSMQGNTREVEQLLDDQAGVAEHHKDEVRYHLVSPDNGILVFGRVGLRFEFACEPKQLPPVRLGQVLGTDRLVNTLFGSAVAIVFLLALVSRLFAAPQTALSIEQLPDRFVSFITDDVDAAKEFKKDMKLRREEKARKKKEKAETKPAPNDRKQPVKTAMRQSPADVERQKIREKVASKGVVGAIGRARRKKGALADVLDGGGLGINLNDAVQAMDRGAQARVLTSQGESGTPMPSLVARRGSTDAVGEGIKDEGPKTGRAGRRATKGSRLAGRSEAQISLALPSSAAKLSGGTLSRKEIAKVVQRNKGAIRYCYESQLTRFPTLRGKVIVDFIIENDGSVRTVKIPDNKLSNKSAGEKVKSCLIRFIKRWRFPKPKGGKVRVVYPFTFGRTK